MRVRWAFVVAGVVLACSKPAPPPERRAPWPAQSASAAASAKTKAPDSWQVASNGEAEVVLKSQRRTIVLRTKVSRGQLLIPLDDLESMAGSFAFDLGAILLEDKDGEIDRAATTRARNWLNLGDSHPEVTRAERRFAEYRIEKVSAASTRAAHRGRASAENVREVDLTWVGSLEFNGYRGRYEVPVTVAFTYGGAPGPSTKPTALEVRSRTAVGVELADHDILPRDAAGTLLSAELPFFRSEIARRAQVTLKLGATPR